MKKLLSWLLTCAMVLCLFAALPQSVKAADIPEVKDFPAEPDISIDKLDQFKAYYEGLNQGTLEDGRTYKIYVPEGARRDASCYYIAVPNGVDTAEFLVNTGWKAIADRDLVDLCFFEPADQTWGDWEAESGYFRAAYAQFSGTTYVYHDIFNWRYIGYGEGGELMQQYAMLNPMQVSAYAQLGAQGTMTAEEMEAIGSQPFMVRSWETPVKVGEAALPIWILAGEDVDIDAEVAYFRAANDTEDEPILLAGNALQYNQKPFSSNVFTYDQKVGTVKVTRLSEVDYYDAALTEDMYKFVNLYARSGSGSPYSNSLTRSVSDDTFIREEEVVNGWQREWYIYTPSTWDGEQSLPMVIFFHGTGQSGLLAQRQGDWWKIAEQKNFIAVCPSGSLENVRAAGKIPQMSWNVEGYGNADEIPFIKWLIDHMVEKYHVDPGRVYTTGQSNGGRMSIYTALALPHDVTATASAGASSLLTGNGNFAWKGVDGEYFLPDDLDESAIVPYMNTLGEYDVANFDLTDPASDASLRTNYFCSRYGLDYENRMTYKNGKDTYTIWENEDGVPLLENIIIGGRAHSHRPEENKIMWDEWFCRFSRDPETGVIYYGDRAVG